ncbi:MAG: DoxX family protein [Pseudomonadota bacterium]
MKVLFFVSKGLLSIGFLATAFSKLTMQEAILESLSSLGYPDYLAYILGVAYVLGIVGIWQPRSMLLKEWAYIGLFIAMVGAIASHLFSGDPFSAMAAAIVFWLLIVGSYVLEKRYESERNGSG